MRIFLSYGHDANEILVRRIKADLEKRGHDVWFDKNPEKEKGIPPGADWRHAITEGIKRSDQVLSFLSKHSTRDPGVCRDEIAIALSEPGGKITTILVESETEVQPPASISHIQWLDMHDWRQAHGEVRITKGEPAVGDEVWEQWYQTKLAEILRVVESEQSRRFAGEIETLKEYLNPIRSDARIGSLLSKGFYGREWLFQAVDEWRQAVKPDSRLFWITGDPGVGKSAFAAQLTHTRGDMIIAAQFCEWDKPDHHNARRVVRSLAFQIAARLPDYRKFLLDLAEIGKLDQKNAAELFDYLLANPLYRAIRREPPSRYLILIDALDEAGTGGRNELVEMLAQNLSRLPDWISLVVTSRPEVDVTSSLCPEAFKPTVLETTSERNRGDIAFYLLEKLGKKLQEFAEAERFIDAIYAKSEGVFLYIEYVCPQFQEGDLSLERLKGLPQGLGGIFSQFFHRQFGGELGYYAEKIVPLLRLIMSAFEPLTLGFLRRQCGIDSGTDLFRRLNRLGSLFPCSGQTDDDTIRPFHLSLGDWLGDRQRAGNYVIAAADGQEALARCGWSQFEHGARTMERYFLRWLPSHLQLLGRQFGDGLKLLMDPAFLTAKLQSGYGFELLADYAQLEVR